MAEAASTQVSTAVRHALEPAARYAALVTQTNPLGSAGELLARPDVSAELAAALEAARQAAAAVAAQQWDAAGPPDDPVRANLLADIDRQYGNLERLQDAIRAAYASVPQRQFVPGVTPPGANPQAEAAAERAAAVAGAVRDFARYIALRSRLTVTVASQAAIAARTLEQGRARRAAGERVAKRWQSRQDGKACYWCRKLHGVTIGLESSFLPYLGGPADLTGHGHLTQPPRPYRGELQGPPLHPHCRCKLLIVAEEEPAPAPEPASPPRFITAAQIRAMPEPRYKALTAFIGAALHELGQVLRRLASLP